MSTATATVRARLERLSVLCVFRSRCFLYGVFVWARSAINSQKRRVPARIGVLSSRELHTQLSDFGMSERAIEKLQIVLDTDANGCISREEFVVGMERFMHTWHIHAHSTGVGLWLGNRQSAGQHNGFEIPFFSLSQG